MSQKKYVRQSTGLEIFLSRFSARLHASSSNIDVWLTPDLKREHCATDTTTTRTIERMNFFDRSTETKKKRLIFFDFASWCFANIRKAKDGFSLPIIIIPGMMVFSSPCAFYCGCLICRCAAVAVLFSSSEQNELGILDEERPRSSFINQFDLNMALTQRMLSWAGI